MLLDDIHSDYKSQDVSGTDKIELDSIVEQLFSSEKKSIVAIHAHGEASHFHVKEMVICSSIGDRELNLKNEVVEKGCSSTSCKRVHRTPYFFRKTSGIKANIVLGFTCHGFSCCFEHFQSNNSHVFSFMEADVDNYVSCLDSHSFEVGEIEYWVSRLLDGISLGQLVKELNLSRVRIGKAPTFMLMGFSHSKLNSCQIYYKQSNRLKKIDITKYESQQNLMRTQLESFEGIYYRLIGLLKKENKESLHLNISLLKNIFTEYSYLLESNRSRSLFPSHENLDNYQVRYNKLLNEITSEFFTSILESNIKEDLFYRFARGMKENQSYRSQNCYRCNNLLHSKLLVSPYSNEKRIMNRCLVCGPVSNLIKQSEFIYKTSIRDNTFFFKLEIKDQYLKGSTYLHITFSDKTRGGSAAEKIYISDNNKFDLSLDLPSNLGSELHSVKCIIVNNNGINYLRTRVQKELSNSL